MIRLHRNSCTFPIDTENRIMLLEIKTLLSRLDEGMELSDIVNAALKNYLPSLLSALRRIRTDREMAMLYKGICALETECHVDISD